MKFAGEWPKSSRSSPLVRRSLTNHIFTPHGDVPDDTALRLVVLPPEQCYLREEPRIAFDSALDYVRNHGTKPRYRGNRLLFLAPGLPEEES